eukprot:37415-Alexandrium_andersonii.AAC.1
MPPAMRASPSLSEDHCWRRSCEGRGSACAASVCPRSVGRSCTRAAQLHVRTSAAQNSILRAPKNH